MRIGIEACTWANRRGFGRFTRELVTPLVRNYPQHEFTLVVDQHTAAQCRFPERARVVPVATSAQPTEAASADGSRSPMDLLRMGRAAAALPLDVFFFPTTYTYFPIFGGRRKIVIGIHDATAERHPKLIFPGFRSRTNWRLKTWLALRQADRIVTVSKDARAQLAQVFGLQEADIGLVTEGPDAMFVPLHDEPRKADVRARYALPDGVPLVLYVGGISPHKNLDGLLRALVAVSGPWHAVLVGDHEQDGFFGCHAELVALAAQLGLTQRISFTGFVPDEDLVALYSVATLLVLPSMNEGFGLPVVEAMACGVPVAASNRSSIPEVLGAAGLLFDPLSHADIAASIQRLLADAELRAELRGKGLRRAQSFSWDASAQMLMDILQDVVGHP